MPGWSAADDHEGSGVRRRAEHGYPPWPDGAVKSRPTATEARLASVAACAPAPTRVAWGRPSRPALSVLGQADPSRAGWPAAARPRTATGGAPDGPASRAGALCRRARQPPGSSAGGPAGPVAGAESERPRGSAWTTDPRSGRPRGCSAPDRALVIAVACERPSQRGLPVGRHVASRIQEVARAKRVRWADARWSGASPLISSGPGGARADCTPGPCHSRDGRGGPGARRGRLAGRRLCPPTWCRRRTRSRASRRGRWRSCPRPGRAGRIESGCDRCGAVPYPGAWDVRRGLLLGRREPTNGLATLARLVEQVMRQPRHRRAPHVFWIVDSSPARLGPRAATRLGRRSPTASSPAPLCTPPGPRTWRSPSGSSSPRWSRPLSRTTAPSSAPASWPSRPLLR